MEDNGHESAKRVKGEEKINKYELDGLERGACMAVDGEGHRNRYIGHSVRL
jgi:hypothetical protein